MTDDRADVVKVRSGEGRSLEWRISHVHTYISICAKPLLKKFELITRSLKIKLSAKRRVNCPSILLGAECNNKKPRRYAVYIYGLVSSW